MITNMGKTMSLCKTPFPLTANLDIAMFMRVLPPNDPGSVTQNCGQRVEVRQSGRPMFSVAFSDSHKTNRSDHKTDARRGNKCS